MAIIEKSGSKKYGEFSAAMRGEIVKLRERGGQLRLHSWIRIQILKHVTSIEIDKIE